MAYADHKHPPNAHYPGEEPRTGIDVGPHGISVTLDTWGPRDNIFTTLYDTMTATWGDAPTRSARQDCRCEENPCHPAGECDPFCCQDCRTGWCRLTPEQRVFVEGGFAGKTLQQDLEGLSLYFTISGVSRAFTHEFVRTRIGAAFKQHGGRDNDWRHRRWTMTEAMERMCLADERKDANDNRPELIDVTHESGGKRHPIVDWQPIDDYIDAVADHVHPMKRVTMRMAIEKHLEDGKKLYAAMVDAGVAWQDARRVLPIGTQTYIHGIYNFVGFRGAAANRLEFIMDWEINCVFQLMLREIRMKCPPLISQFLGSHSDIAGKAMFDQLELCPPDGKYPSTTIRCKLCGHSEANHMMPTIDPRIAIPGERICEVCQRSGCWAGTNVADRPFVPPLHIFQGEDTLPRVFRREQQPFWVLHPNSMNGGPIQWLWTNGNYHDIDHQIKEGEPAL